MAISIERQEPLLSGVLKFGPDRNPAIIIAEQGEQPSVYADLELAIQPLDALHGNLHANPNINPFFPHNVSNKAIIEAAVKDPSIFSHYTVVMTSNGLVTTEQFSSVFANQLKPVRRWVSEAASITRDPAFANYLKAVALELELGEEKHEETTEAWLGMDHEPVVDAIIGFFDVYGDNRFNIKHDPHGWVNVLNPELTRELQDFTQSQLEMWRVLASLPEFKNILPPNVPLNPIVKPRAGKDVAFGGLAKVLRPSGNSMPCEPSLREKYGSKFTLFMDSLEDRLIKERLPFLKQVIPSETRNMWQEQDFVQAQTLFITAHEISHSINRRPGDQERFRNTYGYMNEMDATIRGLAILGQREDIPEEQKRLILDIMFATFAEALDAYRNKGQKARKTYLDGYETIAENLVESGAVRIDREGYIRYKTADVYSQLMKLLLISENDLASCGRNTARKRRGSFEAFPTLERLKPFRDPPPGVSIAKVA